MPTSVKRIPDGHRTVARARELKPVADQFYGDRSGQLQDPFGPLWWVATHKEDVGSDEMQRRVQALFAKAT